MNNLLQMLGFRPYPGHNVPPTVVNKLVEKYGDEKARNAVTNLGIMLMRLKETDLAKVGASFSVEDGLSICCESSTVNEDKFFFLFMLAVMNIMVAREAKEELVKIKWTPEQMKIFYDGVQLLAANYVDVKETKKMLLFTGAKPIEENRSEDNA